MTKSVAHVPTPNAAKYLVQLCKHWSHKLDVELGENYGTVRFPAATASMRADACELSIEIEAADEEELARIKGVVASHLDRFAFREAPLSFDWQALSSHHK